MTMARVRYTDVDELVNHLKTITDELTALHGDLYWLAMQAQGSPEKNTNEKLPHAAELNVGLLMALKGAVDNMRLMLWDYIEAASEVDSHGVRAEMESQRVKRMTQFLELLRERLGRSTEQEPLSFIERISAAVTQRLGDRVA
jgi:hypothetical protein